MSAPTMPPFLSGQGNSLPSLSVVYTINSLPVSSSSASSSSCLPSGLENKAEQDLDLLWLPKSLPSTSHDYLRNKQSPQWLSLLNLKQPIGQWRPKSTSTVARKQSFCNVITLQKIAAASGKAGAWSGRKRSAAELTNFHLSLRTEICVWAHGRQHLGPSHKLSRDAKNGSWKTEEQYN